MASHHTSVNLKGRMMSYDILVVGSCNMDMHWFTQSLPIPGETILGKKFVQGFGGKGGNEAVAAAKLGAKVSLIAMVGDDNFGESYIQNLKTNNVHTEFVGIVHLSTGMASITIDQYGQNFIIVIPGANYMLTPNELNKILYNNKNLAKSKVLITQREVPEAVVIEALKWAKGYFSSPSDVANINNDTNIYTIFNPSPIAKDEREDLFKSGIFNFCDIIVLNEVEISILLATESSNQDKLEKPKDLDFYKELLQQLSQIIPTVKVIILTLGSLGVLFFERSTGTNTQQKGTSDITIKHVVTPKVEAVDTSGAGDSFLGCLAYYYALHPNLDLHQKINRACYIASQTVKIRGTQSSYPKKDDLPTFLF